MNERSESNGYENAAGTGADCPIDLASALERVMGDRGFLEKMLVQFDAGIDTFLADIRSAVEKEDAIQLAKTAHKLKGAAVTLSLEKIARSASEITRMGRESRIDSVGEGLCALERAVGEFRSYLEKFRSETSGS